AVGVGDGRAREHHGQRRPQRRLGDGGRPGRDVVGVGRADRLERPRARRHRAQRDAERVIDRFRQRPVRDPGVVPHGLRHQRGDLRQRPRHRDGRADRDGGGPGVQHQFHQRGQHRAEDGHRQGQHGHAERGRLDHRRPGIAGHQHRRPDVEHRRARRPRHVGRPAGNPRGADRHRRRRPARHVHGQRRPGL
ncbi:MAG: hypothetical protein AVDCRST_MAG64-1700, partial [uncultured Phycisphaerae bacterium]